MDRDFAKVMMRHQDAIDLHFGAMTEIIREHAPDELKAQMLKGIASCIAELMFSVRSPIVRAFPDLETDPK
jgi:hypothetical protein